MKIVVSNSVTMSVGKYVEYMHRTAGYNMAELMQNKDKMMQELQQYINNVVVGNDNNVPKEYNWAWRDGKSPMTWIFQFIVLPQQDLTVIYNFTCKRTVEMINKPAIKENAEWQKIRSLMERMGIIGK